MKNTNNIVNDAFLEKLQKMDDNLFQRKQSWLIVKDKKWRIFIINGVYVKLKRRYYWNLKTKTYVFLLDKEMKVEKSQHLNQAYKTYIINKIVSAKSSYRKVAQNPNDFFSKSTVHRVIKNAVVIENHLLNNLESCEENNKIIVNVDDTFNSLLVENSRTKSQFRVLNFYQEDKNKHKINEKLWF